MWHGILIVILFIFFLFFLNVLNDWFKEIQKSLEGMQDILKEIKNQRKLQ